jgi:hypothetical protein
MTILVPNPLVDLFGANSHADLYVWLPSYCMPVSPKTTASYHLRSILVLFISLARLFVFRLVELERSSHLVLRRQHEQLGQLLV